jgi:hypothetical protein
VDETNNRFPVGITMALVSQIVAASYAAIVAEARKAANQWAESAYMREMERQGAVDRINFGSQIEAPLDYQPNPGTAFLASSLQPTSLAETEVVTDAVYSIAELSIPVTWSKKTEAQNPSENQKIALVKQLVTNGLDSHDNAVEQAFFVANTNGFLGLPTHITSAGTGSDGGIDSSTDVFWKNKTATYVDDTDIESAMTSAWNAATKGSGSKLSPTLGVSDGDTQAIFEGTQQANQRWIDTEELKAGFKILGFKTMRYVFSQFGTSTIYMSNPKNLMLECSKTFFRDRGETQEIPNANGYTFKIYSALQFITNNRSRLAAVHV